MKEQTEYDKMKTPTRSDYMTGKATHQQYYMGLASIIGIDTLRSILPSTIEERRAAFGSGDYYPNKIPLQSWDDRHELVISLLNGRGGQLKQINGTGGWSRSDTVCTLKAVAIFEIDGLTA